MNVAELRRQHVRDHVIPEACVTDREPWPCTIAQLLATAETGEAGLPHAEEAPTEAEAERRDAALDAAALRAPVADAGLDVERLIERCGRAIGLDYLTATHGRSMLDSLMMVFRAEYAATPTEPPADSPDVLDVAWAEAESALPKGWRAWGLTMLPGSAVAFIHGREAYRSAEHPTPTAALRALIARAVLPRVNGNGFTPEQQKALDNHAEPYPGNTEEA